MWWRILRGWVSRVWVVWVWVVWVWIVWVWISRVRLFWSGKKQDRQYWSLNTCTTGSA
ncbi:MAG: hypothetical protein LBH09_05025 [Peptococcaceae bacterium]|nr:hypothetical protein [Peptococcaceae bacterium]